MKSLFIVLSVALSTLSTSIQAAHLKHQYLQRGHNQHGIRIRNDTSPTKNMTTTSSTSTSTSSSVPMPSATPTGKWGYAIARAKTVVSGMSVEDKVALATGVGWEEEPCIGNTAAIPSINFTGLCLQDSPTGVRSVDLVSAFPAGINAVATFNRDLMHARALAMGAEFKGKGVNIALAPGMNMIRAPRAGRNWEMFGADPYLSGEGSFETVTGLQANGLQACAKHFIANEQETNRQNGSSNVDDRTIHEVYLHPFLKAVQAGVTAIMCSYNQVNETYSCENDHVLNDLLKTELGFQGFVTTDWWADVDKYKTLAANQGLDMVMPGQAVYEGNVSYFGPALVNAVNSGKVPTSRLDDMATRILAAYYVQGQDQGYPAVNFNTWNASQGQHVNVQDDHGSLIRTIGAASTVLLKNVGGQLPLGNLETIALVGSDAGKNPNGTNSCPDRSCDIGILAVGWGSGTTNFPYLIDPLSAITAKANTLNTSVISSLSDTNLNAAMNAAAGKNVALVFITSDSGEGYLTVEGNPGDRNTLYAWHGGDALVQAVASVNKNTIVVIHAVGAIIMEAWIDHPNVTAVIHAGLQGQEAGNTLVDILWGAVNPSGRLPYTVAKSPSDYSADIGLNHDVDYTEGLYIDYRWFDLKNIAPRFEFGFGLSYTSFSYSALVITCQGGQNGGFQAPTGAGSSLSGWLHDDWVIVTFMLKNTGATDGTEIPQLYIVAPASANSPPKQLRGFDSVFLAQDESSMVKISLSRYSFSVWNVLTQRWEIPRGTYGIWVGASSRDRRLYGTIDI